jgi:N-acetylneuraminic acid mutarotase
MRIIGLRTICLLGITLAVAACGGSSSTSTVTTSTNYTVGGTITGLAVSGVVLANGSATVTVSAGASVWEFPATFPAGSSYSVTVQTQPTGELCEVTSGASGTDTGSVGNVVVVCGFGQWTWRAGPDTVNGSANYGTQGAPASSNVPGARYSASSWTDSAGNLWLFGGVGYDSTGATGYLSDLWRYSLSTKLWTWVSGGVGDNVSGVYGSQGVAAASNLPGARYDASSWTDSAGNLWLFGGYGYDSTGALSPLNDLWRFSPSSGQWTWVSGANIANAYGVYGTQGTAAATNAPGARYSASTSVDSSGNLWLFGGYGSVSASVGGAGRLNDLWKYSPSSGQWTWVSGSDGPNASGVYGTAGTAAAGQGPGGRYSANIWIDSTGDLWLFGGYGYDSTGAVGKLNDLWKYVPSTGLWDWITGEDVANATGYYGTLGTNVTTSNQPGARYSANSWIDSSGNLWLFGGYGNDSTGSVGSLNDLWRYNPTSGDWTWFSGGTTDNASGVYGTLGTAAASDVLGARYSANSWVDSSGNFWLFGGYGYDSNGSAGYLNDLWQFDPSAGT